MGDLQVVYEHYHRYLLARPLVEGKRVLDLASGEGYGAALLAERAEHVVGLEIDPASVAHSQGTYPNGRLDFVEGSMLDLSRFPDRSFDVVTCFEALEHVTGHDELVSGVRRVLAADGVFLTSTPDRLIYTEELHQHNPHHVRELSLDEFRELLDGHFRHVRIWGQAVAVGSLIQPVEDDQPGGADVVALANRGESWVEQSSYPPTYYIAAASGVPLPVLPAQSILVDVDIALVRSAQRALLERSSELDSRTAELTSRTAELTSRTAELGVVKEEQLRLSEHLTVLDEREESSRAQLAVLESAVGEAHAERDRARDNLAVLDEREESSRAQLALLESAVVEAHAERDRAQDNMAVCEQELSAVRRSYLHRAAFSGQRFVARLALVTRRTSRQEQSGPDHLTRGDS
jgi:SAM-dependent methyltransferase